MDDLKNIVLDRILPLVQKPGQYAGGERNSIIKDHASVDLTVALAFPDTYAIGMSHLGMKILYHVLNGRDDVAAERVFAPWTDMEAELRGRALPLHTLETFTPVGAFDVIGFSMQYELCYTNVLNMLELAGVPLETDKRTAGDPVVIAGGSITLAMEPLAPFLDAVLVGDAEDAVGRLVDTIIAWKRDGASREELHRRLAGIPGMYVPSLYRVRYGTDGTIERIDALPPAPPQVRKITVGDFEHAPVPTAPIIPNVEVIHDRINIEIMRGCPHQCRFCQAAQRYRPLNIRSVERIVELCEETFRNTGYEEINLAGLSTADYPGIEALIALIASRFESRRVNVSLPSLRVGDELRNIPALTSMVRKAGLTFAPEVGTERLRGVIGKPISNEDLLRGCEAAYRAGYRLLKFYFMIGVPGETDEDLAAIVDLTSRASLLRKRIGGGRGTINAAVSSHVPKPHTAFQWEAMNTRAELRAKQSYILSRKRVASVRYKFHGVDEGYIEATFSRGDRRLAAALLKARERGIRLDAWSECFDVRAWMEVFQEAALDPDFYALRKRRTDEVLPWDMIAAHTPKAFLLKEKERLDESVSRNP
jgi:radical SAM family uncharacterized protein